MLKFLKISGVIFLLSMFAMGFCGFNSLLFVSTFTLFVIAVIVNLVVIWKGKNVFNVVADKTFDNGIQYFKNKKFGKSVVNFMAYPMCVVGIFFATISLICMWLMAIKS